MVRLSLASLPFLGLVLLSDTVAHAEEPWWRDPERGCGKVENWKRTSRIADLPGCDGELKSGAPPGEVAMHDAKKLLHDVEKQLDNGQAGDAIFPMMSPEKSFSDFMIVEELLARGGAYAALYDAQFTGAATQL